MRVRVKWLDGAETERNLDDASPIADEPRVRYLSQQFVERLCSAEGGVTDELLAEIEQVIFAAHSHDERAGASTFTELRMAKTKRGRLSRARHEEALGSLGREISDERAKQASLGGLKAREAVLEQRLKSGQAARAGLIIGDDGSQATRLQEIIAATEGRQGDLDGLKKQLSSVLELRDAATDLRSRRLPTIQAELVRDHAAAALTPAEWKPFALTFAGDVNSVIDSRLAKVNEELARTTGPDTARQPGEVITAHPYVDDADDLARVPLSALRLEEERLKASIGLDAAKTAQLKVLDGKISETNTELAEIRITVKDAQDAPGRIATLLKQRMADYGGIFDAIVDEEAQLAALYKPLAAVLEAEGGIIGRLGFSVKRVVDLDGWAARGEQLLDLRKTGPFKGHGALREAAEDILLDAWTRGSSTEVAKAMGLFRERYEQGLRDQAQVDTGDVVKYWEWGVRVSDWLTSAEHVTIRYGIEYDEVDVERLSPGTRGIVLLLLYLSIDRNDDRPLIIDQPEENLDPKSIFDELVDRFASTRLRRQVIIVTHNANLIVNTDVDQVIVAEAGPHRPGQLPSLVYTTGGLEDRGIRREVCKILEGGERAFKERARRLRVELD